MNVSERKPSLADLGRLSRTRFLTLKDLKVGDILFALDPTSLEPCHTSIVTSREDNGAVQLLHQVQDKAFEGLHANDVVPTNLLVLRCTNEKLARKAANYALRWAEVPAPYSTLRASIAKDHENKHIGSGNIVGIHRQLFQKVGKFRAIKYAARREGILVTINEQSSIAGNKGMFCSMFVAVCFQVAGLENVVFAAPREAGAVVSDKRLLDRDRRVFRKQCEGKVAEADLMEFEQYLNHLHEKDPYDLNTDSTRFKANKQTGHQRPFYSTLTSSPSLAFWREDVGKLSQFNFADCITEGMMLDCKVIYPRGLLACLRADEKGWSSMGILTGGRKFSETPPEKNARMKQQQERINKLYFH